MALCVLLQSRTADCLWKSQVEAGAPGAFLGRAQHARLSFFWPILITSPAGAYPPISDYISTLYTVLLRKEHSVNPGTENEAVVFLTMS